jgi:hypothetical protein
MELSDDCSSRLFLAPKIYVPRVRRHFENKKLSQQADIFFHLHLSTSCSKQVESMAGFRLSSMISDLCVYMDRIYCLSWKFLHRRIFSHSNSIF